MSEKRKSEKVNNIIERVKKSEQLISMILGIIIVLAIGGLSYRYFQKEQGQKLPEKKEEISQEKKESKEEKKYPRIHQVSPGENLWKIAEKYYQSGYNWIDIAKKNNLKNPDVLLIGQELEIPDVPAKKSTITQLPQTGAGAIQGDQYTVRKGDSLSKIAGLAYGDIFSWPKIWSANRDKIANPNLIFPGQVLKIPR